MSAQANTPIPKQPRGWLHRSHARGRCLQLMLCLFGLILIIPFFHGSAIRPSPSLALLSSLVLLSGLYAVSDRRRTLLIGVLLLLPAVGNHWVSFGDNPTPITASQCGFVILFLLFTITHITRYVFRGERVTDDKLYGAISVYLLIGLLFNWVYVLIETLTPGSFHISETANADGVLNWGDLLYFSYVTLTTLGYGDIIPISPHARTFAVIESITGVLYIGVMVARIVSAMVAHRAANDVDTG